MGFVGSKIQNNTRRIHLKCISELLYRTVMSVIEHSPSFVPMNLFSLWCLLPDRCQGSSSVCTLQCWTGVSSWCLSDFPYCVSVPGRPGAWMTFSPPFHPWRFRGLARSRSDGSRDAGSPGLEPRGRASASSPSGRPWCSAGCLPPVRARERSFSYAEMSTPSATF